MISEALNRYAASSARVWARDRTQTVGASEVGLCARRVFFGKNEADPVYGIPRNVDHLDGWGASTRGTVYEDAWWAPAIKAAYGARALYVGAEQRTFVSGFSSGTPDGLLVGMAANCLAHLGVIDIEGGSLVLDCKSIDPRVRLDEPKPEHAFQVITNLGLIREMTEHRPVWGLLSYTDASFWDQTKEFPVRFDEAVYAEAKRRARDVMLATSAEQLRPEGVIAGGKECEFCPFTEACGQARADRVPKAETPVDAALLETVAALAHKSADASARAKSAAVEQREIEEEIRALLAEAGTKKIEADGIKIRWSAVKGRSSYDNAGIREAAITAGVAVERFLRSGDPSDRLSIVLSQIPSADAPGVPAAMAASRKQ